MPAKASCVCGSCRNCKSRERSARLYKPHPRQVCRCGVCHRCKKRAIATRYVEKLRAGMPIGRPLICRCGNCSECEARLERRRETQREWNRRRREAECSGSPPAVASRTADSLDEKFDMYFKAKGWD